MVQCVTGFLLMPAFLAVADQNPSFTGCPTFTRQLMPKRKICLSFLLGNCHHFIATDPRPMGFPDLASAPALCAAALRRRSTASSTFREIRPAPTLYGFLRNLAYLD